MSFLIFAQNITKQKLPYSKILAKLSVFSRLKTYPGMFAPATESSRHKTSIKSAIPLFNRNSMWQLEFNKNFCKESTINSKHFVEHSSCRPHLSDRWFVICSQMLLTHGHSHIMWKKCPQLIRFTKKTQRDWIIFFSHHELVVN